MHICTSHPLLIVFCHKRLSARALLHLNYGMSIDYEELLSAFTRKHSRRMTMLDVSGSHCWTVIALDFFYFLILSVIVSVAKYVLAWSMHQ